MERLFLVGLGGFIGSVARYTMGGAIARMKQGSSFPLETLVINIFGCLLIGFLAALAESRGVFTGTTRAFLLIGVLGGFTTFSTFGYETFQMLRDGQFTSAAVSSGLQVGLGICAVWAGHSLARLGWGA